MVRGIQWKYVDDLVEFSKVIVGIIGWAFYSTAYTNDTEYFLTDDAKRMSYSLEQLLDDLGLINNVV